MTGVKLDLMSDNDMYLFCEQGIRGGVSVISQRFAESNAKSSQDDPAEREKVTSSTSMQIICMAGPCLNTCPSLDFIGLAVTRWMQ